MLSNLDRYKKDLESLITSGSELQNAIQAECHPEDFKVAVKKHFKSGAAKELDSKKLDSVVQEYIKALPSFKEKY